LGRLFLCQLPKAAKLPGTRQTRWFSALRSAISGAKTRGYGTGFGDRPKSSWLTEKRALTEKGAGCKRCRNTFLQQAKGNIPRKLSIKIVMSYYSLPISYTPKKHYPQPLKPYFKP
jgi:hypothetical protein